MQEEQIRTVLNTHWHASAAGDANGEFHNGKVVHETQYFGDPFEAPAWRRQWAQQVA